jgi:hypothetical protein
MFRQALLGAALADRLAEMLALVTAAAAPAGGRKLLDEDEDGPRDRGPAEHEEQDRERKVVPRHSDFSIGGLVGTP